MTIELPKDDPDYSPQLYDSATGDSLIAERVVDITADCPKGERTILLFTRAKRGRIVQVNWPYENEKFMGARIHYFVDELRDMKDFGHDARRVGMDAGTFIKLIERLAPAA